MDDKFKKMTEIAVNDTDMTNALLGKVFDVLTSGGTVGMESGNNFYCWLPVGQAHRSSKERYLHEPLHELPGGELPNERTSWHPSEIHTDFRTSPF